MYRIAHFALTACCLVSVWNNASAQSPQWLDDQTVAVIRINLKDPNTLGSIDRIIDSLPQAANELKIWQNQLKAIGESIAAANAEELLIVYSLADDFRDQPLWVVPKAKGLKLEPFQRSFAANGALNPLQKSFVIKSAELGGSTILGSGPTIERVKANKTTASQSMLEMTAEPNSAMTVHLTLNPDQRRAAWEMLPEVPAFLGGGRASELLKQIQWLRLNLVGQAPGNIELSANGDPSGIAARLMNIQSQLSVSPGPDAAPAASSFGKLLVEQMSAQSAKTQGQTITWTLPVQATLNSGAADIIENLLLKGDEVRAHSQLKTLGLAVHNYYSAMSRFPSPLSSSNGKSPRKLSWRVDLLPFLDEVELYNQFHHDEAWDSPHNRTLISRMPYVYRFPQSKHTLESGLSTIALPSAAETMWPADKSIDFKDIEDGTSNTIMIVEVSDDMAQEWTKPDSFQVNLQNPAAQLGGHFKDKIFFAAGDGSSHRIKREKFADLKALLTRAGSEPVSW